ncbi:inositol monophosphatase family protein [Lysinibacillus endophyticus]|uniref:Inositol monophosphatase family protein n=1 Tax=Ureibacillus endophyticus TaxID=1978490 RepID=A0A494Z5A5_9BACL|nr:inositol monophosphatase family protein [Lysinibacillus endophyticus]MCP1143893.1 inositol monophosphatase family protein [Lysinibacillus endophyticus]RKQ17718.1 inositol monophosphatase family protein [Lysinibacillus endophyticus]
MDLKHVDKFAKEMIFEAGRRIRQSFSYDLKIETKSGANDLVTNVDRETELFFIESIKAFDATHKVLGEEGMGEKVHSLEGPVWIIDPIDGTMNFVKQHRHFFITIGFYVDGVGKLGYIFDVMREDLFCAIAGEGAWYNGSPLRKLQPLTIDEAVIGINASWVTPNKHINHEKIIELVRTVRGTRSYGSAAMEIAFVVSGKLDAYISMRLAPWDIGGGIVIAKEVGAIATNLNGQDCDLLNSDTFIIANPYIHHKIVEDYIEEK